MAEEKKKSTRGRKKKVEDNSALIVKEEKVVKKENNKEGFKLNEVIIIMVITLFFGLFFGSYFAYKKYSNDNVDCSSIDKESAEIINVYNDIVTNYYGDVDKEALVDSAIQGMVSSLSDKYAGFFDKENGISLDEELKGSFTGLGVQIRANEDGTIEVVSLFEDSPAEKNGIEVGDIIVKMDSKEYNSSTMSELVTLIKSSKVGDVKTIEVLRNGQPLTIKIALDTVNLSSVTSYHVIKNDKKIGVLSIDNFAANTYDQFLTEYEKLEKEKVDALVIDLRQNGGGYLSSAHSIVSLFLDKDAVVYQRTAGDSVEEILSNSDKKITLPVVLVVDEGTASSSEVFASSLKENLGVPVVGKKTYGKGTIQKLVSLSNGRYIKYTTLEWLTAKGNKIEGVGIEPTEIVDYDPSNGNDNQLERAFEIASRQ